MHAVGRPARVFIPARAMGKLYEILASYVHYKNVEVPRFKSARPRKRDVLAIRVPRRVDRIPFPSGQAGNIRSVNTHSIYLRCASAPRKENKFGSTLRIYLFFHFERPRVAPAGKPSPLPTFHSPLLPPP